MYVTWLLIGYLCGSISSAILICRLLGHADPRTVGSHNPGTTNVLRLYGKWAAAFTLAGDVGKGVLPVVAASMLSQDAMFTAAAGLGAFIGHLYPAYFKFVGGKGVATLIGVLLAFDLRLGGAFIGCWILVALITRYSSLSALVATASNPLIALAVGTPWPIVTVIAIMAALVFWRHTANIRNLLDGKESKIGKKAN